MEVTRVTEFPVTQDTRIIYMATEYYRYDEYASNGSGIYSTKNSIEDSYDNPLNLTDLSKSDTIFVAYLGREVATSSLIVTNSQSNTIYWNKSAAERDSITFNSVYHRHGISKSQKLSAPNNTISDIYTDTIFSRVAATVTGDSSTVLVVGEEARETVLSSGGLLSLVVAEMIDWKNRDCHQTRRQVSLKVGDSSSTSRYTITCLSDLVSIDIGEDTMMTVEAIEYDEEDFIVIGGQLRIIIIATELEENPVLSDEPTTLICLLKTEEKSIATLNFASKFRNRIDKSFDRPNLVVLSPTRYDEEAYSDIMSTPKQKSLPDFEMTDSESTTSAAPPASESLLQSYSILNDSHDHHINDNTTTMMPVNQVEKLKTRCTKLKSRARQEARLHRQAASTVTRLKGKIEEMKLADVLVQQELLTLNKKLHAAQTTVKKYRDGAKSSSKAKKDTILKLEIQTTDARRTAEAEKLKNVELNSQIAVLKSSVAESNRLHESDKRKIGYLKQEVLSLQRALKYTSTSNTTDAENIVRDYKSKWISAQGVIRKLKAKLQCATAGNAEYLAINDVPKVTLSNHPTTTTTQQLNSILNQEFPLVDEESIEEDDIYVQKSSEWSNISEDDMVLDCDEEDYYCHDDLAAMDISTTVDYPLKEFRPCDSLLPTTTGDDDNIIEPDDKLTEDTENVFSLLDIANNDVYLSQEKTEMYSPPPPPPELYSPVRPTVRNTDKSFSLKELPDIKQKPSDCRSAEHTNE